ncbi:MAG: hypothetical protein ACLR2O_04565 [Coprococcus sp.]
MDTITGRDDRLSQRVVDAADKTRCQAAAIIWRSSSLCDQADYHF